MIMEENTQLPKEVVEEITYEAEEKAEAFFKNLQAEFPEGDFSNQIAQQIGFRKGHRGAATAYASKLQQARALIEKMSERCKGLYHDELANEIKTFLYGE